MFPILEGVTGCAVLTMCVHVAYSIYSHVDMLVCVHLHIGVHACMCLYVQTRSPTSDAFRKCSPL